jgi:hypothetical protein
VSEFRLASRSIDGNAEWQTERTPIWPWLSSSIKGRIIHSYLQNQWLLLHQKKGHQSQQPNKHTDMMIEKKSLMNQRRKSHHKHQVENEMIVYGKNWFGVNATLAKQMRNVVLSRCLSKR